jgi:3-hydroxyisobutyrate dehydrogenase-like beta-hydroxyacid dehydrogenase
VAQTVRFIALGDMELPIARNLAKADYRLRVHILHHTVPQLL